MLALSRNLGFLPLAVSLSSWCTLNASNPAAVKSIKLRWRANKLQTRGLQRMAEAQRGIELAQSSTAATAEVDPSLVHEVSANLPVQILCVL